jgi:hypothetical protein
MWLRLLLAGAALAGLLSACSVIDPVDNRYDTISRSLAKSRNESIFLNLVRASHDYPLSFVTISNVTPSLTNTSSVGLPTFLFGPHVPIYSATGAGGAAAATTSVGLFTPGRDVIFNNTTASDTTAVSTNFNVSTQETSAFYQGFLKPIDLETLNYFIRQGYPRELLFWLFTDSFELQKGGNLYGYHYNPPDDYGCSQTDPMHRCFIDWVHNAAYTGLTVEEKTLQRQAPPNAKSDSTGGGAGAKPTTYSYARFCFNQVLGQEAQATVPREVAMASLRDLDIQPYTQLYKTDNNCGDPSWQPSPDNQNAQPDILPLNFYPPGVPAPEPGAPGGPTPLLSFTIVPRSAYGVFEFLGAIIRMQLGQMSRSQYVYIPPNRKYAAELPTLQTVHPDKDLMDVTRNLGGDCFVHTWFEDGDYCVPDQADTTKRVFALLAQLIAIQTAASDLSITPIVKILQ